jgi:hypothetical protein
MAVVFLHVYFLFLFTVQGKIFGGYSVSYRYASFMCNPEVSSLVSSSILWLLETQFEYLNDVLPQMRIAI